MKDKQALLKSIVEIMGTGNIAAQARELKDDLCSTIVETLPHEVHNQYGYLLDECNQWEIWADESILYLAAPGPVSHLTNDLDSLKSGQIWITQATYSPTNGTFSAGHIIVTGRKSGGLE